MNNFISIQQNLTDEITTEFDIGISLKNFGHVYLDQGDVNKGLDYYKRALEIKRISFPEVNSEIASIHNCIGNVYSKIGDFNKALSIYEKILDIQQEILAMKKTSNGFCSEKEIAGSLNNIGFIHCQLGNAQKALDYHNQALGIQREILIYRISNVLEDNFQIFIVFFFDQV